MRRTAAGFEGLCDVRQMTQKLRERIFLRAAKLELANGRLPAGWADACEIRLPRVEGYRVELPEERLTAVFSEDSTLELTPKRVGPSETRNEGKRITRQVA